MTKTPDDGIDQLLTPAALARLLSESGAGAVPTCSPASIPSIPSITTDQVTALATRGRLIRPDGTISLLEYTAFLILEFATNG